MYCIKSGHTHDQKMAEESPRRGLGETLSKNRRMHRSMFARSPLFREKTNFEILPRMYVLKGGVFYVTWAQNNSPSSTCRTRL